MGYIIALIVAAVAIVFIVRLMKKKKISLWKIVGSAIGIALFALLLAGGIYCIRYYVENKKFNSFNLDEIKRQEFLIQRIDFKKFLIQGNEVDVSDSMYKYKDELQVYLVTGYTNVVFTDIEKLQIDEEKSDKNTRTLYLKYMGLEKQMPFKVDVVIDENDIYKVTSFESKTIDFLGFKKDLIKPEMSQDEKVKSVKEELKKEFEKQVIVNTNTKKIEDSEIYQIFIARLSDLITNMSDWEKVIVVFEK